MNNFLEYFKRDAFAAANGIELIECRPGYAKAQVKIEAKHLNAANVVHGGLLFTLADFAFAAAVNTYGNVTLSINASISYVGNINDGIITAEAKEVARSNKLSNCDINIFDSAGTLLANFKGLAYITKTTITY